MKKIRQSIAFTAFLLLLSIGAFSQTSASKTKKIKTLLELTGSTNLGKQMMNQIISIFNSNTPKISETFWDNFRKEIDMESLTDKIIPIYDRNYTESDIDGLIAFYQSDLGKKVTASLPLVMQESMQVGQVWGKEVGEKVMKKLKEEKDKKP